MLHFALSSYLIFVTISNHINKWHWLRFRLYKSFLQFPNAREFLPREYHANQRISPARKDSHPSVGGLGAGSNNPFRLDEIHERSCFTDPALAASNRGNLWRLCYQLLIAKLRFQAVFAPTGLLLGYNLTPREFNQHPR